MSALDEVVKNHRPLCDRFRVGLAAKCTCGIEEAQVELAQLNELAKEPLSVSKRIKRLSSENVQLRAENKELARVAAEAMVTADRANVELRASLAQKQAALDEARKVIEIIDNLHPDFSVIAEMAAANLEEKE